MSKLEDTKGPYTVWENNGCEGWQPYSFNTLLECLEKQKYSSEWVITKRITYEVKEID
jgi:hypothetical protein